jgi:folylpolyglutamate synthase/dihydropteroate synthase
MLFEHIAATQIRVGAVVCTSMRNKDVAATFASIPEDAPVFAALLDFPRAAGADQLAAALDSKRLEAVGPSAEMLARARAEVDQGDSDPQNAVILVFGSIYLLGECFAALGIEADSLVSDVG